tara:strand:+ start:114 stop:1244 length:1131 start_codon:yes stop_codon:yes gene_type:complete
MLALVGGLFGACGIGGQRQLRDAFPDLGVLVTTADPARVRAELANVTLPDSDSHNMELLAMLRGRETVTAAHLVLLVRAVALPENIICSNGAGKWTYPQRGKSEHAAFVDQLLTEGAAKLDDVDGYWLGELIGISQSDATMMMLCEQYVPAVDDGSERAFDELLRGMPGSPAMLPFLSLYMGPQGRLDGARGWHAFGKMSFDNDRVALLETLLQRNEELSDERVLMAMKAFSFDNGRERALELLVDRASPLDAETARAAASTFSFDSGRGAAFATLAKRGGVVMEESQLARFVGLCSFDADRVKCVQLFAPKLQGEPRGKAANSLLSKLSFDSGRLKVVELMASRWVQLSKDERFALLQVFSFDSSRKQATRLLMR